MKTTIRLTENDLHNIIKSVINESLNTVQLQLINGYFYPVDSVSARILEKEFELGRIPENRLDVLSPKLVRMGYKLAISNYSPKPTSNRPSGFGAKIGGDVKPQKNPCTKCGLNGLCDSDECGKKGFRLYSNK